MTYNSRGRSMTEVVLAVGFVSFLIGFVAVLCIGNYYRAKRAMERQKQKRLARLSGNAGNGVIGIDSPRSDRSSVISNTPSYNEEQQQLIMGSRTRRRNNANHGGEEPTDSLLLDVVEAVPRANITAV